MRPTWLQVPVPDELAAPLGYAWWTAQYLEHLVYWVLRRLTSPDPPEQGHFTSFGDLAAASRVAVQGLMPEERRKYKAWLALADKAVTLRNDLAHAVPVTTPEGTQGLFRRRPNQAAGIVRSTVKEIDTMTKHFQEANLAGSALLDELGRDED